MLSVVASTNVYGDIVKQIAGDKVEVTSIISDPAQDPHSYEANATTQLALSKADLVIENGGGYDDFVDTMLKTASNGSVRVINAVELSGKQAPAGGELNEHVWYDFPSVAKVATAITGALSASAPADAALFERNAAHSPGSSPTWKHRKQRSRPLTPAPGSPSPSRCRCTCWRRAAW